MPERGTNCGKQPADQHSRENTQKRVCRGVCYPGLHGSLTLASGPRCNQVYLVLRVELLSWGDKQATRNDPTDLRPVCM